MECTVENFTHSKIEYLIKAKTQFKSRSIANNVEIIIPVPSDADSPTFKSNIGTVKYVPDQDSMVWCVKQFPGQKEFIMRAHFGFPSVAGEDRQKFSKRPISVRFEIPYFTVSGIQVTQSSLFLGAILENYREEWLPSPSMGKIHNPKWRISA